MRNKANKTLLWTEYTENDKINISPQFSFDNHRYSQRKTSRVEWRAANIREKRKLNKKKVRTPEKRDIGNREHVSSSEMDWVK